MPPSTVEAVDPPLEGTPDPAPSTTGVAASLLFGSLSLLLLVVVVLSKLFGADLSTEAAVILFGFFGLGSAPLQVLAPVDGAKFFAAAVGLGVGVVLLTGFALVELHGWSLGTPVFVVLAVAAAALHVLGVKRSLERITLPSARAVVDRLGLDTGMSQAVVILSLGGAAVSVGAAVADVHLIPRPGGLPTSITPVFFVGVVALLVGLFLSWRYRPGLLALPVVVLALVLTGVPSVVYDLPRYDWTQSHIGLTLYFLQHGSANSRLSVYRAWPGFFAGIAWLLHAGGVSDVEGLARWWSPVADVTGAGIVVYLARAFGATRRNSWLAAFLFVAGNTIGQDYYSPQAASYVGYLALLAAVVRPVYAADADPYGPSAIVGPRPRRTRSAGPTDWAVLVILSLALAVSHPLTPFVTAGIVVLLAFFGVLSSRWMALAPVVPAVLWAALHGSVVAKYFNIDQVGNVGANLQSPSSSYHYHYTVYAHVGIVGQALAPMIVGLMALVALVATRDRRSWALATCAASCAMLLVAVHYGNEDIFRTTLFALPLLAVLACRFDWATTRLRSVVIAGMLPLITAAYLVGDTGFDYIYVVRPTDLRTIETFERTAPPFATLISVSDEAYTPIDSSPRYTLFDQQFYNIPIHEEQGAASMQTEADRLTASVGASIRSTYRDHGTLQHVYLVTLQQAAAEWAEGGVLTLAQYAEFAAAIAVSPEWQVVQHTSTSTLFRFRSAYVLADRHPADGLAPAGT